MMGLYFDEIETGAARDLGNYQFTDENITSFSTRFAPVPFHMNDDAAAKGLFGKRSAVGFHICSAWMPCFVAANQRERDKLAAQGKPLPETGAGFGLMDIRWLAPVFAGDVIAWRTTVISKRELKSKPKWGLLEVTNEGHRNSECVVRFGSKMLVARRS